MTYPASVHAIDATASRTVRVGVLSDVCLGSGAAVGTSRLLEPSSIPF
jgi:hypothetical protein